MPTGAKRKHRSEQKMVVPVKFTRSGTPYVDSAVAVMPPQALCLLIRERLDAKKDSFE